MTPPSIDDFAETARRFCSLAESERPLDESDIPLIRDLLVNVLLHIRDVEAGPKGTEYDGRPPEEVQIENSRERFRKLPVDSYRVALRPLEPDACQDTIAEKISDDLIAVYEGLSTGLSLVGIAWGDACLDWIQGYRYEWGGNAIQALMAIELYRIGKCRRSHFG